MKKLNYDMLGAVELKTLENGATLIKQPNPSYICTQCSVAMVADIDLKESFEAFGHSELSNLGEAYDALKKLGYVSTKYLRKVDNRKSLDLQGRGILVIVAKGRAIGHAVAFKDGIIYDPAGRIFHSERELRANYYSRHGFKWSVLNALYVEPASTVL